MLSVQKQIKSIRKLIVWENSSYYPDLERECFGRVNLEAKFVVLEDFLKQTMKANSDTSMESLYEASLYLLIIVD